MSLTSLLSNTVDRWKHPPAHVPQLDSFVPDVANLPPDSRRLIRDRRYCRVLAENGGVPFDDLSLACAWRALEHEMAMVPEGSVRLDVDVADATADGLAIISVPDVITQVSSFYIDCTCVTNAEFAKFISSGGYGNAEYWPESILSSISQFVDRSGAQGPREWNQGDPPADKLDHPVVGISWYEANAYATWVGKSLPTSQQWQRAGTSAAAQGSGMGGGMECRYPWGNAFDPGRANTWAHGIGDTIAVSELSGGATPHGVKQLIGNVWEWVDTEFSPVVTEGVSIVLEETMAEVRGGAFDTYFHSQANCRFRTGQPLTSRSTNVGFRCCINAQQLATESRPQELNSAETER